MTTKTFNEPLQPEWPVNVLVFKPTDDVKEIKAKIGQTEDPLEPYSLDGKTGYLNRNSSHHFNTKHYALLFAPGEYKDCDFEVGYYVGMAGLGKDAKGKNAVRFTGENSGPYVPALNKHLPGERKQIGLGLCLDTFWRSAENYSAENTTWAVSQAAPLRRIHIAKDLKFGEGDAWSSGGFLANGEIEGTTEYICNQQWFSRGCTFGNAKNAVWNSVFSGCTGSVPQANVKEGNLVTTVEEKPHIRMEKPFIVLNSEGNYELHVPKSTTEATAGAQLVDDNCDIRPFSRVKVGRPHLPFDGKGSKVENYKNHDDDTYNILTDKDEMITSDLQAALDEGKDLLLCPGLFFLTRTLVVKHANQVILGIGLATLIAPQNGSPCIRVQAKKSGVRIAGLMLEASQQSKSPNTVGHNSDGKRSLLSFGEPHVTDDAGDQKNPGLISDIFTRVGGSNLERRNVSTDIMVRVHSGNVIGDNLWLWRADHVRLAEGETPNDEKYPLYHQTRIWKDNEDGTREKVNECDAKNAIEVTGNDVKMYGLFCEHTTEHQCVWTGERGSTTFFQCELPYDVDIDYAHDKFTGYYVDDNVEKHAARGIGVYSNFTCYPVKVDSGMQLPSKEGIILENPLTLALGGSGNIGAISNVVHQGKALVGEATNAKNMTGRAWVGEKRAVVKLI